MAGRYALTLAIDSTEAQASTEKIDSQEYLVLLRHINGRQSDEKIKSIKALQKNENYYLQSVENDIKFDSILTPDGVINLACVSEKSKNQKRSYKEKCS